MERSEESKNEKRYEEALDYIANQLSNAYTGANWLDLDSKSKDFWRNEARNVVGEWIAETSHWKSIREADASPKP